MRSRRHTLVALLVAGALLGAGAPLAAPLAASAAGDKPVAVVQGVDTAAFPEITLAVTLPAELLTSEQPEFVLTENGTSAKVVSVTSDSEESAPVPVGVVLVIDTSGSMAGESIDAAKSAATEFVQTLRTDSSVALVTIGTKPRLASGFTTDRSQLARAISGLQATGETALNDAVAMAAELARTSGSNVAGIVVLSDGGDTMSRLSIDDAVRAVATVGVPVFAVALPSYEADPTALRHLASGSGGRLVAIDDVAGLPDLYRGLAEEMQSRFAVTYRSAQPRTKDLEIEVTARAGGNAAVGGTVVQNPLYSEPLTPVEDVAVPTTGPMETMTLIGSVALVWISIALLVFGVGLWVVRPRTTLAQLKYYEQLQGISGDLPAVEDATDDGLRQKMVGAVGYVAGRRGLTELVRKWLERAGLPLRPAEYMSGHILFVVVTGVIVQLVGSRLWLSLLVVFAATLIPMLILSQRARRRTARFDEQLPDVLNLVSGSLRSGWGMLQAVDLVVQEMLPPAADEFRRVQTETRLGLPVESALRAMAERVASEDFAWAVSAIAIQREVGGNLAEVLDIVATTIRDRGALRRQVKALTAEGKLSAYILIGLPFLELFVLSVVNPSYMSTLFTTPGGLVMSTVGLTLLLVGAIWLNRAMKVEV
ncbi:MAG: VWA domain-containing protein [Actinomycetota bacterium]|nr:VWA domain-containing protein [Actinomycetota bacterium]